jgi:hypothetical protein
MLWVLASVFMSFALVATVLLAAAAARMLRQTDGAAACPAMPDIEAACDDFEVPVFNALGQRISFRKGKAGKQ